MQKVKLISVFGSMAVLAGVVVELNALGMGKAEPALQMVQVEADQTTRAIRTGILSEDNYEYPFNTMSADWGAEDAVYGYYEIPKECAESGGKFPEVVQVFTYCLCRQNGVSYPMVLALIERESGYQYNATGDDGKSKGYMQIYQKFHEDRMKKLNCTDLMNPYDNIRVGIDFLAELTEKYEDERLVLMYYNRGGRNKYGTGALDLWEKGIYETEYSKGILERKAEIERDVEVMR